MKRWLLVAGLGMALASTAQGAGPDEQGPLTDVTVETFGRAAFKLPREYGRLVNVVVSSEIHYLYFEDDAGAIRVVLLGPRGAVPKARAPLQLLSTDVHLIKRGRSDEPS